MILIVIPIFIILFFTIKINVEERIEYDKLMDDKAKFNRKYPPMESKEYDNLPYEQRMQIEYECDKLNMRAHVITSDFVLSTYGHNIATPHPRKPKCK